MSLPALRLGLYSILPKGRRGLVLRAAGARLKLTLNGRGGLSLALPPSYKALPSMATFTTGRLT